MIFFRKKTDPEISDLVKALEDQVKSTMEAHYLSDIKVKSGDRSVEALASTGESIISIGGRGSASFSFKDFVRELAENIDSVLQSLGWSVEEGRVTDKIKLVSETGLSVPGLRDIGGGEIKIISPSGKQRKMKIEVMDLKIKVGVKIEIR